MNLSKIDIAYLAGFWDGEGFVGWMSKGKDKNKRLTVGLSQNDPSVLLWVKEIYGGSIHQQKTGCYHWQTTYRKAERFLRDIYPYVRVREDKVKKALDKLTLDLF